MWEPLPLTTLWIFSLQIFVLRSAIMSEGFYCFCQHIQVNSGIVFPLDHDSLLPNPSYFIIIFMSSCLPTLHIVSILKSSLSNLRKRYRRIFWKKTAVAYFKAASRNVYRGYKTINRKFQQASSGQYDSRTLKFEVGMCVILSPFSVRRRIIVSK
jgi:hypothetical protein